MFELVFTARDARKFQKMRALVGVLDWLYQLDNAWNSSIRMPSKDNTHKYSSILLHPISPLVPPTRGICVANHFTVNTHFDLFLSFQITDTEEGGHGPTPTLIPHKLQPSFRVFCTLSCPLDFKMRYAIVTGGTHRQRSGRGGLSVGKSHSGHKHCVDQRKERRAARE